MTRDDSQARWAHRRVGSMVGGKYRLDAVLGVGGMAVVYKATHRNRAEFAVKMLLPELSRQPDLLARFLREGYAANSVKHPGAVRVLDDAIAEDGAAYVVMELLDGTSVEALADAAGGRLPMSIAIAIGAQMLEVLAAAHAAGVVHRDVKPANLFLTRDGAVKVLDFGIARMRDMVAGAKATQSGVAMGTPAFMSPEQAMGKSQLVDAQSDVWAAGATLFTLTSGELVHQTDSPAELVVRAATRSARSFALAAREAPIELVSVVDRALAFDKEVRWASAAELREALLEGYRKAYGAEPASNAELAAFLESKAPRRAPRSDADATTLPRGATTGVPVETDAAAARAASRTRRAIAIAGGVAVAIGVAAAFAQSARHPTASAPAPASTAAGVPVPTAATPVDEPASPPLVAVDQLPEAPSAAASTPALPMRPRAPLVPVAPAASSAARRSPAVDCNPDYTLDADGNKHFKPECFIK
ncbi:MAG TPA: serine/threonine-protein kinase [Polyangiaceae bacterium]